MKRLINKTTVLYTMLSICLGVFMISIFVGTIGETMMFISGVLTGFVIYEIEESRTNEPA